jgi:hypothetical protein
MVGLMAVAVIACIPMAFVVLRTLGHLDTVSHGAATSGAVRVTSCGRQLLVLPVCRGDFVYSDPGGSVGAQPSGVRHGVVIGNDIRAHAEGSLVAASLDTRTGRAYLGGAGPLLVAVLSIAVILFVVAGTTMTVSRTRRREPVAMAGPIVAFVMAVGIATLMIAPLGDPATPPPGPAPPSVVISSP